MYDLNSIDVTEKELLVVDDTPANIGVLYDILKPEGYLVSVAKSGEEAIRIATRALPDLILLDVMMPGIDGLETCSRLKQIEETRHIPVIFVTAKDDDDDLGRGFKAGAVDYITKPIMKEEVCARVRTHLRQRMLLDELWQISRTDPLTNISNRRHFFDVFHKAWTTAAESKLPLGLIMLDVDYFKRYNDQYGHQAGDNCLVKVAAVIKSLLAESNSLVGRYGGEEFAVLLQSTNLNFTTTLAERIRQEIENLEIEHAASEVAKVITVSCGAAVIIPNVHSAPEMLIKSADDALYRAKDTGRNRIHCE